MAYFKLNDFIGQIQGQDLARANRFEIVLTSPLRFTDDRKVSLLVEEAQVPGLQTKWTATPIGPWTENRVHGIEYFGETAAFTFYCDDTWDVRTYFEEWMGRIQADPRSKEVAFYDDMVGQIDMHALDREDNRTGRWKFYDAFPRLLNITPMAQGGDGIVRVAVTFAFRHWESRVVGGDPNIFDLLNFRNGGLKGAINGAIKDSINDRLDKIFDT
tara:strand:- start:26468 stop:27112 length:645 start_codon:yes stop_codon:yes gene_type:complete